MRVLFGIALLLAVVGVVKAHDHVCDCSFATDTDDWPVECDGLATNTPDGVEKFVRTILCDPTKIVKWTSSLKREVVDEEEFHEVEARSHCARSVGVCTGDDGVAKAYNPARYQCSHEEKRCYEVPPAWRCEPNWFNQATHTPNKPEPDFSAYGNGTKNACHCGCGYADPDCGTELAANAIFCNAPALSALGGNSPVEGDPKTQYCHNPTGSCKTVPEGWTCAAYLYNEYEAHAIPGIRTKYTCDCNCGVWDPDCDVAYRTSCWLGDDVDDVDSNTGIVTDSVQDTKADLVCDEDSDCIVPSESSESSEESESSVSESDDGEAETPVLHSSTRLCHKVSNTCENIPAGWLCPARWYNESGTLSYGPNGIPDCNCGCGVPDPDCDYQHLRTTQGPHFFGLYANAEGDSPPGAYRAVTNPKDVCNKATGEIYRVPNGWSCLPTEYNEVWTENFGPNKKADCNCGCGDVWDPDCDHQDEDSVGLVCHGVRGESTNSREFCSQNTNTCDLVPQSWSENCPAVYYGESLSGSTGTRGKPFCDCFCGSTVDPDCLNQNLRYQNSSNLGLACDSTGAEEEDSLMYCSYQNDTAKCISAPSTWTCSPEYYNEVKSGVHSRGKPYCDCDCGAWDEDCYSDTRADQGFASFGLICDSETGVESTDVREYCSKKNVDQNALNNAGLPVCSRAPDSWFCAGVYWNEFDSQSFDPSSGITCDCGCGLYDYDCNSTIISSSRNYLRCGGGGSRMLNVLGNYIDCSSSCPFCELSDDSNKPK